MKKKGRKPSVIRKQAQIDRALSQAQPVVVPLCELFAVCDDVFTEEGAFTDEHIKKSLGRLHREWKKTRAALDPEFDPKDYERRPRRAGVNPSSPLATGSPLSSTARKSTSGKSRKSNAKTEKSSASKSARRARSSGRALNGR